MTSVYPTVESVNSTKNKVFRSIYGSKYISKQEISSELNLSLPTVAQALKDLYAANLIHKSGYYESTGGRKAEAISVQPLAKISIGVELLNESIKLCATNLSGKTFKEEFEVCPFENTVEYFKHFGAVVNAFIDSTKVPDCNILGVFIAIQGLVSLEGDKVVDGRILGITGITVDTFQQYIRLPCRLIHDTEASAFAEMWQHPEIQNAVYIVLNRNLGGALIINGHLYRGPEFGSCILEHMRLVPNGKLCYCGQRGCLEEYCSVNSLEQSAGMDVDEFFRQLSADNPQIVRIFDEYLHNLAQGITNIRTLIDCEFIIGGFLEPYLSDIHFKMLADMVKDNFAFPSSSFNFRRGCHGSNAASRGAALMIIDDFIKSVQ